MKRPAIALAVLVALAVLFVAQQACATLTDLDKVERERDTWQRPEQVLERLNLRPGLTVLDFGSGAGYFAMKIAPRIEPGGRVLAVDLRRQSLAFLWIRAWRAGYRNLSVIRDEVDDPRVPPGPVDAVLVANTYHELAHPDAVLQVLFTAMRRGGTLVVVDRGPDEGSNDTTANTMPHHEITAEDVQGAIARHGFEIVLRDDRFIDRADGHDRWWLIEFRKP